MPKNCNELKIEQELLEKMKLETSADGMASELEVAPTHSDSENTINQIAKETGAYAETLESQAHNQFGGDPSTNGPAYNEFIEVGNKAEEVVDTGKTPQGRMSLWKQWSDALAKGASDVVGSVDNLPVGGEMKDALRKYGTSQTAMSIGRDVWTGQVEGRNFKHRVQEAFKDINTEVPTDKELFDESVAFAMSMRSEGGFDHDYAEELLDHIDNARVNTPNFGTHQERIVHKTFELIQNEKFQDFVKSEADKLDHLGSTLKQNGVITEAKESYFPNLVRMEVNELKSPAERLLFQKQFSSGDFSKAKVFRSAVEASINGFQPVSFAASDLMDIYHGKAGRRLAMADLKQKISDNREQWRVQTNSDVTERAFYFKGDKGFEGDIPKTEDGRNYLYLGNLHPRFTGMYAHPLIYDGWAKKLFSHVKQEGFVGSYMKLNSALKGLHFGFDVFHAFTLFKKGLEASTAFNPSNALKFLISPISTARTGLDAVAKNNPHVMALMDGGMTMHKEAYEQSMLSQFSFDPVTGEKKSNLFNDIMTVGGLTNITNDLIFHKAQVGWKVGLGLKMVESDVFQKWVKDQGAPQAYKNLATYLNNHFGGQNLAAMGRSNYAQAFFRATMLAPDFQESKWRRNFGIFHSNPQMRQAYRVSLAAQTAFMGTLIIATQAFVDEIRGKKRTPESWMKDSVGHWMDIQIGESDKGRNMYLGIAGAEKEDTRPFISLFNSYYGAYMGKDLTGKESEFYEDTAAKKAFMPLATDLGHEVSNKLSPLMKEFLSFMEKPPLTRDKNKPQKFELGSLVKKPESMFDLPMMPISAQPIAYAATGGFHEKPSERVKDVALAAVTSAVGAPISEGRTQKSESKSKSKKKKKIELF